MLPSLFRVGDDSRGKPALCKRVVNGLLFGRDALGAAGALDLEQSVAVVPVAGKVREAGLESVALQCPHLLEAGGIAAGKMGAVRNVRDENARERSPQHGEDRTLRLALVGRGGLQSCAIPWLMRSSSPVRSRTSFATSSSMAHRRSTWRQAWITVE